MQDSIRILIVEDLPTDAELAQREIRRTFRLCESGYPVDSGDRKM
jgi:hypothetical protein